MKKGTSALRSLSLGELIGIVFIGVRGEGDDDFITPMSGVKFAHEAKHKPNLFASDKQWWHER